MTNQEIIIALETELDKRKTQRDLTQNELFANFNSCFKWRAETLLYLNRYTQILSDIINAESSKDNKMRHIDYFIKEESRRLIDYDRTNKSTSTLDNFQEDVYRNVNKDLIHFLSELLGKNND